MRQLVGRLFSAPVCGKGAFPRAKARRMAFPLLSILPCLALVAGAPLPAQAPNRIAQEVDSTRLQVLPNHHPAWANPANDMGLLPANQDMGQLTLVLARSPEQEQAFEQLIAGQQNPASPEFHHWLTPAEVGERFGLSDPDIATITGWLQAQGLHVNWVSPSRIFIGFGGTAADVGQAFGAALHSYRVNSEQRISVASDPMIPQALAPAIKTVRGLYTIEDRPLHHMTPVESAAPQMTVGSGSTASHYIAPADFNKIYDVPASLTGAGETIGIVAEARTDMADFNNFKSLTGSTFTNPTEVIPTTYGGVDPGAAYTAPPSCESNDSCSNAVTTLLEDQSEATLDVFRTGSVAPGASLLLVVASDASDGVAVDTQYLVETTPVPANVMTISFGECESSAGSAGVSFWDPLFEQAASEGISVFVSSGDSGASGCDTAFAAPPANPAANSPNSICSSSYATCVGGTEFNDTADPSQYWNSTDSAGLLSAVGSIPEGGWNEPGTSSAPQVAASGGGVSAYIPTPKWQTGLGVPGTAGRYTPDISFSASCHDGYFGCMAANGASCVAGSNGSYEFVDYCGTSAAAPGMAGVAALLNQKLGVAQGNLNQQIYQESAATPAAFHDVTVASSGVSSCSVNTPSMCNNSIPGPASQTGGQAGYPVTTGYDQVTGLGSLDVLEFLNDYTTKIVPTVTVSLSASSITTAQTLTVSVSVSGGSGNATPTGSVTVTSGSYTSAAATLASGSASITVPAGSLTAGNDTLAASYAPDASSSSTYAGASGAHSVTVTNAGNATPAVSATPSASSITTAEALTVTVSVAATSGNPTPTGSVTLTGGGYTSAAVTLTSGSANLTVPAGSLATGTDTLTASYAPDSASSAIYNPATGTATVTVTAKVTPAVTVSAAPSSITTAQATTVTVTVAGGYGTPTGSVTLTGGGYTSAAVLLTSGSAGITVPAGSLAAGTDTLTASYTPDSGSSPIYNAATGTATVTVTAAAAPGFAITGANLSVAPGATSGNTSTITVTPSGGFTGSVTLTAQIASGPAGAQDAPTLNFGSTSTVNITGTNAGTATLAVSTTAASQPCTSANTGPRKFPWSAEGGAALACVFLLVIPARRRRWPTLLGVAVFSAVLATGLLACGGGSQSSTCTTPVSSGTTGGTYTITVTGTSNATTETGAVTLTVQ